MRISNAPVPTNSGCTYLLHSVRTANMAFWKHAQVICVCTKPCVVRICCTSLVRCGAQTGMVLPNCCAESQVHVHMFLLGELQILVRKTDLITARSKWSTFVWIYLQGKDWDSATATSLSDYVYYHSICKIVHIFGCVFFYCYCLFCSSIDCFVILFFHQSYSRVKVLWKNLAYLFFPTFINTKMQTLCTPL